MYSVIAIKEWRMMLRSHTLTTAMFSAALLLLIAFVGALKTYRTENDQRNAANRHFRHEWAHQHASDAHGAAHFGTYIFKPPTPLSQFDRGLNNFTGNNMRVEAHIRHTMAIPPLGPADVYLRFGELTPATVLQLFFPLLLIFLCYNSNAQEMNNGTIRLMIVQGISPRKLLMSKAILFSILAFTLVFITLFICLPLIFHLPVDTGHYILLACYACYCCIFVFISISISAIVGNPRKSLLLILSIWLCWNILLPRLAAAAGSTRYLLPDIQAMQTAINQELKSGINGDDPRDKRMHRLEQATLSKYRVKDITMLPVNFEAIRLQAEEDYAQQVYDKYAAAVDSIIRKQNAVTQYAAFADPFLAIRSISMAICGTDYEHHFAFDTAARNYRNDFIRKLNNAMLINQPIDSSFFAAMPAFKQQYPSTTSTVLRQWPFLLSLFFWLIISISLLKLSARYVPYAQLR